MNLLCKFFNKQNENLTSENEMNMEKIQQLQSMTADTNMDIEKHEMNS